MVAQLFTDLRNWAALTRYAEDGRLKIDSNGAEQALRPIVLGRKNWLFAGSEAAAHRTAILCSLVQTCKHLQINPFIYLRDVIERVSTHPARLVLELTPTRVEGAKADLPRPSSRLNGAFLSIRPRLLLVSPISIYVSIGTSDHEFAAFGLLDPQPKDFFVAGRWTTIATHEAPRTRREKRKDDAELNYAQLPIHPELTNPP
jgi:hypothetical protein